MPRRTAAPALSRIELLQGTLDLIVLQSLRWGPRHGYGLVQLIRANSRGVLQVDAGSLYPALHRLEEQGFIDAEWETVGVSPACSCLQAHAVRTQTARRRTVAMGAVVAGDVRPVHAPCGAGNVRLFRRSRQTREAELEAEIRAHLDMAMRERIAQGVSPDEAARQAELDFGNTVTVREVTSDMWNTQWLSQGIQDARYAVRSLLRVPGFALIAVLTLALGIGANTAIFSVINGVILRPLPFPKPQQLVYITSQFPLLGFDQFWVDRAEFLEFRERNHAFQDVGAFAVGAVNVAADEAPQRVTSAAVSASLFNTLAVTPLQGRAFTSEETLPNAAPVVILSQELWQSAFGGRAVVGHQIDVNGVKRAVVGVMPAGFDVHDQGVKLWLPLVIDPAQRSQYRGGHFLYLIGRLKNGVSLQQARRELEPLLAQWIVADGGTVGAAQGTPGAVHAPNTKTHRLRYDDLQQDMVGGIGRALWLLQAAVAFVLLIACANLANLLLMRAESRHKEIAVRAALGAGRAQLIRHFIAESLVLSLAGAVAGTVLAHFGLRALIAAGSASIPRAQSIAIDSRVLAFTLALALGTGVLFGLAPMLHLSSGSLGLALRDAGSRTTSASARNRVRRGLVIAETGARRHARDRRGVVVAQLLEPRSRRRRI